MCMRNVQACRVDANYNCCSRVAYVHYISNVSTYALQLCKRISIGSGMPRTYFHFVIRRK